MENIIAKLVEIEKTASACAMRTEDELRNLDKKIKQMQEEIMREKEAETQEKVKEIIDNMLNEVNKRLAEIEERGSNQLASFNRQYTDNREKWQNEIFTAIIQ